MGMKKNNLQSDFHRFKKNISDSLPFLKQIFKEKGLRGELIRGAAGSFGLKTASVFMGLISSLVLARVLRPEKFGFYTFAFSIVIMLSVPAQLGLPNLLVRYVAQYEVQEEWGKLKGVMKRSNQAVLIFSLVAVICGFFLAFVLFSSVTSDEAVVFYWALLLIPIASLGALKAAALRGLRYIVLGLAPDKVIQQGLLVAGVIMVYYIISAKSVSAETTMIIHVLAAAISFLIGAWWLINRLPDKVRKAKPEFKNKKWINVALPFLFIGGSQILIGRIDIAMLGWYSDSANVGLYEVAVKSSKIVSFGLIAMNLIVAPYFSRLYHSDKINLNNNSTVLQKNN
jgi:O-antigen/teichoic acid export membrane protein